MIYNDLQHEAIALNLFFSSTFPVISLFSSHLSLVLHTYAIEDVSVSRDSPRLTAVIKMFPLYFLLDKSVAEILSD